MLAGELLLGLVKRLDSGERLKLGVLQVSLIELLLAPALLDFNLLFALANLVVLLLIKVADPLLLSSFLKFELTKGLYLGVFIHARLHRFFRADQV